MSDTELWQAWRERGDADAFTTLVERYLDMVYATARRILGNAHDAEDVAQDCFIALLKGRVAVQHPLGPWLHCVARNCALDKIKGESRRRDRERMFHEASALSGETAIDDILEHVDAAIDALPADQRAAIIGRFLEGKTNQALGDALGVSESTIRHRIGKGVEGIRARLKERGVITTAAALGAVLESNLADAAPLELRTAIAKIALATPPQGLTPRGLPSPLLIAGLAMGLIALLISGYTVVSGDFRSHFDQLGLSPQPRAEVTVTTQPIRATQAPSPRAATSASAASPKNTALSTLTEAATEPGLEEPTATVSGTIYDERGYPLPDATVTVASKFGPYAFDKMRVFTATTGADGRYIVDGITFYSLRQGYSSNEDGLQTYEKPVPYGVVHVYAAADGYQSKGEQRPVEPGSHAKGIDYTLERGFTMHGRLIWPDGHPAANAGLSARHYKADLGSYGLSNEALCATDKDGYFQMGLPSPGSVWLVAVTEDDVPTFFEEVPAREGEVAQLTIAPRSGLSGTITGGNGQPLSGAYVVAVGRFGLVEKPDFAGQIESHNAAEIGSAYMQGVYTDRNGVYRFDALAAIPDAVLHIDAPHSYSTTPQRLLSHHIGPLPAGQESKIDIALPATDEVMTITVLVLGEQTGLPLPFTLVQILKTDTQKEMGLVPGFEAPFYPIERELAEPGTYVLWPQYNNRGWTDERVVYGQEVVWEPGAERSITFRIPDPFTLSVRVVDPDGIPIADADVECIGDNAAFRMEHTDAEGKLRWWGFAPNAPAWFQVSKAGYSTDETESITGEPAGDYPEQTVVLYPTGGVEGRLVDGEVGLIANRMVEVIFEADDATWLERQEQKTVRTAFVETDAEGNFVWLDGIPAVPGSLTVTSLGTLVSGPMSVEVTAGVVLQLGDLVQQVSEEP